MENWTFFHEPFVQHSSVPFSARGLVRQWIQSAPGLVRPSLFIFPLFSVTMTMIARPVGSLYTHSSDLPCVPKCVRWLANCSLHAETIVRTFSCKPHAIALIEKEMLCTHNEGDVLCCAVMCCFVLSFVVMSCHVLYFACCAVLLWQKKQDLTSMAFVLLCFKTVASWRTSQECTHPLLKSDETF